jgi:hypothetical protein
MTVQFTATSDVNQVLADWDKLRAKNEQLTAKLSDMTGESGKAEAAQKKALAELARFADRTRAAVREPAEEMQSQLAKIGEAQQKGMLTQQEATRATDQQISRYVDAAKAGGGYSQALEKITADQRSGQLSVDQYGTATDRLIRAMGDGGPVADRFRKEIDDLRSAHASGRITAEEYARGIQDVGKRFDEHNRGAAEGTSSVQDLGNAVGGAIAKYVSYAAVIRLAADALKYKHEQQKLATASVDALADSNRRLAQIADPATGRGLDALEARADELAARYGESRETVRSALFSAVSEGFEADLENLVRYGDIVDLQAAAGVAGQVPGLFQGADLTPTEAVSATLMAAQQSRLGFEEIARAMPAISEGAALTGASPTEAMGVLSVMAGRFSSGDVAATRFRGLATRMSLDERFEGQGMVGGVETLMGMDEEERSEFLGRSQELNVAYQTLAESMPAVRERIAELNAELETMRAGGDSALERQYQEYFSESDRGQMRLAREAQRQEAIRREIALEQAAAHEGFTRQASIDERQRRMIEEEGTGWEASVNRMIVERADEMGAGAAADALMTTGKWWERAMDVVTPYSPYWSPERHERLRTNPEIPLGAPLDTPLDNPTSRVLSEIRDLEQVNADATREQTEELRRQNELAPRSGGSARASDALAGAQRQGR